MNAELERLEGFVRELPQYMEAGGRILILSYHSVEDRMVKRLSRELAKQKIVELIKPDPRMPTQEELGENFPSRSAKLREMKVL